MTKDELRRSILDLVGKFADGMDTARPAPGRDVIPASAKVIGSAELVRMADAVLDGWLTAGRFNDQFEERMAGYLGLRHVLTTNSGSSANLVALHALGSPLLGERALRPGDEVIGVAAGFPTTVNPILQFGAVPVFVDVEIPTYNIDPARLHAAISPRTRAIMIAHTLGNPFNLDVVRSACREHGLWLVEDCCDALGSRYHGRLAGTFGDIATFSFYPAHHITMGEGGAVATNNALLYTAARSLRDWGRDCYCPAGKENTCGRRFCQKSGQLPEGYDHKYTYSHLGFNLKITDIQAACALAQFDRLDGFVDARRRNFAFLRRRLAPLGDRIVLPEPTAGAEPSWFGFPITLRPEAGTDRVVMLEYLEERKIGTRLLFAGNLTRQPYMEGRAYRVSGSLEATDIVMKDTFWIGVHPGLGEEQLEYVARTIAAFLGDF